MNKNIARNSNFNIKIDFEKSKGSYLYDSNLNKMFLDLFGIYSSLPLGYNDEIFDDKYEKIINKISKFKVSNCEFITDEAIEFDKKFVNFGTNKLYQNFHYCCTGALAIEAAIKTAILYKKHKNPNIICFSNSFHGINSYSGFLTSKTNNFSKRIESFPEKFVKRFNINFSEEELKNYILNNEVTAILVEPIQCSAGDIFIDKQFFSTLQKYSKEYDIPYIFDEIQTGFGSTGKLWFFENINIIPDIVVFGKKTQVSGIMAKSKYSEIFEKSYMLEPTWSGDIIDMVRSTFIMNAYEKYDILQNVNDVSDFINLKIDKNNIFKFKSTGFIMSLTLENQETRNKLVKHLFNNNIICNISENNIIRLRPNLKFSKEEASLFLGNLALFDDK